MAHPLVESLVLAELSKLRSEQAEIALILKTRKDGLAAYQEAKARIKDEIAALEIELGDIEDGV